MAVAAALPSPLARRRVEAGEDTVVEAEDEAVVEDQVGELRLQPRALPDHGRAQGAALLVREGENLAADTVPRREEQPLARQGQGRRDVRLLRGPGVLPQERPRLGIVAGHAGVIEDDDLGPAPQGHELGRAVARAVVAARPGPLARLRVVGDERPAFAAACAHDDLALHDQGRAALAPARVPSSVLVHDLVRPEEPAGLEVEGVQDAGRSLGEDASLHDRGRRPRSDPCDHRLVARLVGVAPEGPAGGEVVGHHELFRTALLLGDGQAILDGEGGPAGADGVTPDEPGRVARPIRGKAGSRQGRVAVRSEELRPRRGERSHDGSGRR
jgi:hypothetical protein